MAAGQGPRRYNSPERSESSNRTRLAILAASEEVFRDRGYVAGTIRAIAETAGIAVPTVYLHFRSKAELVRALAEHVTSAPDLSVSQVVADGSGAQRLRLGASILRRLHERAEVVTDVLRIAAAADPEIALEWSRWQARHLHAVTQLVAALAEDGLLRSGVSRRAAADALYALAGADIYRLLVRERGWSSDDYEAWIAETGRRLLLDQS